MEPKINDAAPHFTGEAVPEILFFVYAETLHRVIMVG
jgi:hypothetical protein